jgi:hypothetical protein
MDRFDPLYIEIDGGRVHAPAVIHDHRGRHLDYSRMGDFVFFVDVVEADGGRLGVWDGLSYEDAIREAEAARRGFAIEGPVRDVVLGGKDGGGGE